jgi:hypothetical protein
VGRGVNPRRIGLAALIVVMAAAGWYVFVYLYRWEWNRALISGVIFLAAEVAIIGWALNRRLGELRQRLDEDRARQIGGHLAAARRSERSSAFDWLSPTSNRTNVFVPILMGAGLVLSGLAWLVERLARATAGRAADQGLAHRLSRLAPPPGGFLDDRADPLRDLRAPIGGRR